MNILAYIVWLDDTVGQQNRKSKAVLSIFLPGEVTFMRVHVISTYVPAKCGIAEYASDLVKALENIGVKVNVIAVDQGVEHLTYPSNVSYVIKRDSERDYIEAAEYVNSEDADVVLVQHEYGIFGGRWGCHLLRFMEKVDAPLVTTLHTVIPPLDDFMDEVTQRILELSNVTTVMSRGSLRVLHECYDIDGCDVRIVPHGVRFIQTEGKDYIKAKLGISNRFVMSTIGFLSSNKGIEYAIMALPKIKRYVSNILYLIVGTVHPKQKQTHGDSYYERLVNLAEDLKVKDQVLFINAFPEKENYVRYIVASDVIVLPYTNEMQVSSGFLAHALSYGKAIVSTPFVHAKDLLSNGRGLLCKFKDPDSVADAVIKLAGDPDLRAEIEAKALRYGLRFKWENVAEVLLRIFMEASLRREKTYVIPAYAQESQRIY